MSDDWIRIQNDFIIMGDGPSLPGWSFPGPCALAVESTQRAGGENKTGEQQRKGGGASRVVLYLKCHMTQHSDSVSHLTLFKVQDRERQHTVPWASILFKSKGHD